MISHMTLYVRIDIGAALAKAVEHLGYEQLSLEQCEAIRHFVDGQEVFVSITTVAGKSLSYMYLLLPIVFDFLLGHLTREGRPRTGSAQHSIVVAQNFAYVARLHYIICGLRYSWELFPHVHVNQYYVI